jgi:hypothetical protein
VPLTPK